MYPDRSVPNKVHFREIKLFFCEFASKYNLFMDEIPQVVYMSSKKETLNHQKIKRDNQPIN